MVNAKHSSSSNRTASQSCWVDVDRDGGGDDKWNEAEGLVLLDMLREARRRNDAPDLYVITPFSIVQAKLRDLLLKSDVLRGWVPDPRAWVKERIGTVHTVQGREAPTVFFVLGASEDRQSGARAWAGQAPNLLNVAVTRAKTTIYVIGNRKRWQRAGYFGVLARMLPVKKA
jgi:superfamily I DNA and/or RNA helicase